MALAFRPRIDDRLTRVGGPAPWHRRAGWGQIQALVASYDIDHLRQLGTGALELVQKLVMSGRGELLEMGIDVGAEPGIRSGRQQEDSGERHAESARRQEVDDVVSPEALVDPHQGALQKGPADEACHHEGPAAKDQDG